MWKNQDHNQKEPSNSLLSRGGLGKELRFALFSAACMVTHWFMTK